MALAVGLFIAHRRAGLAGIALAALLGFSRVYLGVHYPTDVIGGLALGTAVTLLLSPSPRPSSPRSPSSSPARRRWAAWSGPRRAPGTRPSRWRRSGSGSRAGSGRRTGYARSRAPSASAAAGTATWPPERAARPEGSGCRDGAQPVLVRPVPLGVRPRLRPGSARRSPPPAGAVRGTEAPLLHGGGEMGRGGAVGSATTSTVLVRLPASSAGVLFLRTGCDPAVT
ncbi:phosphatase PAP2 family protein [Actinomadura keratinilytica]